MAKPLSCVARIAAQVLAANRHSKFLVAPGSFGRRLFPRIASGVVFAQLLSSHRSVVVRQESAGPGDEGADIAGPASVRCVSQSRFGQADRPGPRSCSAAIATDRDAGGLVVYRVRGATRRVRTG